MAPWISTAVSQSWEEQAAKWSPFALLPDSTEGTGDTQHPPLRWKEVHGQVTVTQPGLHREWLSKVSLLLLLIVTLSSNKKNKMDTTSLEIA